MKSSFAIAGAASHFTRRRGTPRSWIGLRLSSALLLGLGMLLTLRTSPAPTLVAAAPLSAIPTPSTPFYLEKNVGQAPTGVRFLAHAGSQTVYITNRGAVISTTGRSLLRMTPLGGALHPQVVATGKLPGIVNYFIGNNPKHWYTNIPTYAQVTYRNVYPGIDLTFHGQGQDLEYDWIVKPGADPNRIRLSAGTDTPSLDAHGALHLGSLPLLETEPTIYQRSGSVQRSVRGGYVLAGRDTVRFQVGHYDRSRPLVIDPVILFAEFLGGSGEDYPSGVKVDPKGNIYLTGNTDSTDFPVKSSFQSTSHGYDDMFMMKLSSNGKLLYSTFIGGKSDDHANALAIDGSGQAYIAGDTSSIDFPTVPQATISRSDGRRCAVAEFAG